MSTPTTFTKLAKHRKVAGTSTRRARQKGEEHPDIFHNTGLIYFWVINDGTDRERLRQCADRLKTQGIAAVVLHPRSGLRVPYGSDEWFELTAWLVERCEARGLQVWLYDEDPFPSGNAGGRVVAAHPAWAARQITCHTFDPADNAAASEGDGTRVFRFPLEPLLWCGLIDPATADAHTDLTSHVGVLREAWTVLEEWDSRHYYPQTPRYACPRAWTKQPTHAIRVPDDLGGLKLVAFVAEPVSSGHWGHLADTLNAEATRAFVRLTHQRYADTLGDRLGNTIPAIFTDEAKPAGAVPYTPGLFESFEQSFGYALAPRLAHLFATGEQPSQMRTRIDFRRWVAKRFQDSWIQPVRAWCEAHRLHLVGHFSPEDDPVEQAASLGNLMPIHKQLAMPGIDLIIPAVGDDQHAILNIGIIGARSVCDQQHRPGVLSESLACSGIRPNHRVARRVLAWQTVMGLTSPVIHAAYESMEGNRAIDAPPDWGPMTDDWPQMCQLGVDLQPMQLVLGRSRQVAPVAVVWPIRSYLALGVGNPQHDLPLRQELLDLMTLLLDAQVGFHFVDEADLAEADLSEGLVAVGAARYSHLIVPPALILHQATIDQLREAAQRGVDVRGIGQAPTYADRDKHMDRVNLDWPQHAVGMPALEALPRVVQLGSPPANVRATAWSHNQGTTVFLTQLNQTTIDLEVDGQTLQLKPGDVWSRPPHGAWTRCFEGLQDKPPDPTSS